MTTASVQWLLRPIEDTSEHAYITVDSGAYSIWRSGAKVNVEKYYNYCHTVRDMVLTCVNMDQIPGKWGKRASPVQVEEACAASFAMWQRLAATGALIMAVYHQTDDLVWLDRYLDAGAIYIGISPTDSFSAQIRQKWLVDVHDYMVSRGVKLNKEVFTHGLGVFAPRILEGIPLWSADASTLLRYVAMKRILIPAYTNNKITGWEPIYVGTRATPTTNENVDWDYVKAYLASIGYDDKYTVAKHGRVLIDDYCDTISINLNLARLAMHQSQVRCFVAGQLPLAIWQVAIVERYPYILRSYAAIRETTGSTIEKIFKRQWEKPPRRPERDHKVKPVKGLFTT